VPAVISLDARKAINPARWDAAGKLLEQDRINRYKTGAVNYMKVVTPIPGELCSLGGKEAYDFFIATVDDAPTWRNQITYESFEKMREFDAAAMIQWVSPAAMLLIPAEKDYILPYDAVKAAYDRAKEPKGISPLPVAHFDVYTEPWLSLAAGMAVDWFKKYL
jgi:uncharacterized protein